MDLKSTKIISLSNQTPKENRSRTKGYHMGPKEIRSSIYFYPFSQQINHTLSESQQYVMSSL